MALLCRRPRRLATLLPRQARRWLSDSVRSEDGQVLKVPLESLAHQSQLLFQVGDATPTHVEVVPTLAAADFALHVALPTGAPADSQATDFFAISKEIGADGGAVQSVRITKQSGSTIDALHVQLMVPHLIDLSLSLVQGAVKIHDKIEGDVKVTAGMGDITASKLRGTNINLKTNKGAIAVTSLIEGESVALVGDAISCKRAMAGSLTAKLGKASTMGDFGAIYSSAASITSAGTGELKVGSIHGYLRVVGEGLERVQVDSANGALEVEDSGDDCAVTAHFDSWSAGSTSSILVGGDVNVSVQPSVPIDVELHGTKVDVSDACTFDDGETEQLDEDYVIFTGELKADKASATRGAGSSGKINIEGAKSSALTTSFFVADGENDDKDEEASDRPPRLLVHAARGHVTLDQLDWMANIKRKHLRK